MKKTLILLFVLIALAGAAYYFVFYKKDTTLNKKETEFAVKDTAAITKITITQKNGKKAELTREGNVWMINHKYRARFRNVKVVLGTLNTLSVKSPVNKNAVDNALKYISANGLKVEIFGKEGEIKTFYIGSSTPDEKATILRLEGAKSPYVVEIPKWEGYITPQFPTEETDWRDRMVLTQSVDSIRNITIDFPEKSVTNVVLNKKDAKWFLYDTKEVEAAKMNKYLSNLKKMEIEAYAQKRFPTAGDSLLKITPFATMNIEFHDGKGKKIIFYVRKMKEEGNDSLYTDLDRYWGFVEDIPKSSPDELVFLQNVVFRDVLVTRAYFLENKKPEKKKK